MPNTNRAKPVRRVLCAWGSSSRLLLLAVIFAAVQLLHPGTAPAHEGHDHDKPAPLNLPVAPRVVAVTPDYELVGVVSGEQRLTIFLHHFATGEPVKNAKLAVAAGEQEVEAAAKEDGVFEAIAPWLRSPEPIDLMFKLTLPNDQDILVGRLERVSNPKIAEGLAPAASYQTVAVGIGALIAGVLLTLLVSGSLRRRQQETTAGFERGERTSEPEVKVKQLRRAPVAVLTLVIIGPLLLPVPAKSQAAVNLPSVPATMATDVPQRMADGSLFVPKATQHLLSVRTIVTAAEKAPRTVQLVGTVIADPNSFGRVQAARPGRIEIPDGGLGHVGKRVVKVELLGYLLPYIEAADKANIESQIAEAEARIVKLRTILSRYNERPGTMPQVKVDEVEGELNALLRKRAELQPSLVVREEIRAPVSGVISVANVVAGQIVDAREVLFEIVDPARFWIEAIAHDASATKNISAAFAVTNSGEKLPLEFVGLGLSLKQQAVPLTFKVAQTSSDLSIGKPVTVILQSSVEVIGIVLPASSVVRSSSGLSIVWVKTEPERFEPHTVRHEPLDGQRVVITAGLKSEVRVVTDAATLLNQIR